MSFETRNRLVLEVPSEPPGPYTGNDKYECELNKVARRLHELWFLQRQRLWLGEEFMFTPDGLSLATWVAGGAIQDFEPRVRQVARLIGRPPDNTESTGYPTGDGKAQFWLTAEWEIQSEGREWRVLVRMAPYNCKVDPRTPSVEAKYPELHPECKQVLDSVTDMDLGDAQQNLLPAPGS